MKIAVIGTGNVGSALAGKWAQAGHLVHLGVRDLKAFKGKSLEGLPGIQVLSIQEAVSASDIILMAVPAMAVIEAAKSLGDTSGKVIIDSMNIVMGRGPEGYSNTSEAILANTQTTEVVKCFNTTGFNNMQDPVYQGMKLDMFVAGDSVHGVEMAKTLSLDAGFGSCIHIGGNDKFQLMEQFAFFWINLAMFRGMGREIGFKLLMR